ncbi:DUF349 domain-containing protein [Marinobacter xestospongiae]|uniref:DUF349 domain-containing protein n=1 Tax=Marinobacter xestospongiae TaxID=994319 RepID=A0ABU3W0J0_9GAMM|nr:DUF349 domain-containing protein [Marinobacter xestospongiae]MDV2080052.1 DUF349 domain-containing protein [Marinobacter xestospongiae]
MAAFIQKLFKSRKQTTAPAPKAAVPEAEPQPDRQDELRAEQQRQLSASPSMEQLEILASQGVTADIRRQAAQAIDSPDALQRLQKLAKGKDKAVFQIARQKLQDLRHSEEAEARLQIRIQELIQSARDQARSDDTKLFQARLEALQQQWQEVSPQASPQHNTDFLSAVQACRERADALKAEAAEQARHIDQARERADTLSLLEDTLSGLRQPGDPSPSVASVDALQKTQENRWLEATRETSVDKAEQKRYESAMQALKAYLAAARRLSQKTADIEALTSREDGDEQNDAIKALLNDIDWPTGFPRPEPIETLVAQLRARQPAPAPVPPADDQKALVKELKATLDTLEQALEADRLKDSRQLFKKAQQQHKALSQHNGRALNARLQLLGGRLRELNDWQGFATQPKQEALCEQMEYLAEQPIEPETKAERIRELQHEWRNLGGSSDRNLWTRFKQASDRAYEPCKAYFAAKSGLKQNNLQKREVICDELQVFVDNSDWQSVDWKAVDQILRTARNEWKAAWPVEFRDNRPVQKRFDDLIQRIETPLNEERGRNEALKQDIVDRAQALISHEPLRDAMDQAKALQTEWSNIGVTRHREDRKLWRAFRQACDDIFARREAQRNQQEQQSREAEDQLETLLTETAALDGLASEPALVEARNRLQTLQQSPLSKAMTERARSERDRLTVLLESAKLRARVEQWMDLVSGDGEPEQKKDWQKRSSELQALSAQDIVIRAEILTETPSPDSDQAQRMEIQVQRLSEGLGGGSNSGSTSDQLESLVAAWCLAQASEQRTPELQQRLLQALKNL